MSATEQDALKEDIEQHGQRDPITIYDGMVLDGWHRYQACKMLEIYPLTVAFNATEDPVAFVKSRNMHRRHLEKSQKAGIIVACNQWAESGRPKKGETISPIATIAQMAKEAEVSERLIQQAKSAEIGGLGKEVREGIITAKKAAEIVKPPTPKPKPPIIEPEPEEPKPETITILKEQFDEMNDMIQESLAEEKALANMLDAEPDDRLAEATEQIKQLVEQLRLTKFSLDGANNANNELKRLIKSKDKEIAKLKKELETYKIAEVGL
jgi:hypothetical protein